MAITKNKLKDIKSLSTKKGRKEKRQFLAEGVRLLEESLRHEYPPELVCFAPALISPRGKQLIDSFENRQVPVIPLKAQQYRSISDTKTPQGILGVFTTPRKELSELCRGGCRRVLLCDGVSDPGNLGTLMRSALAFGFETLVLTGTCSEPFAPKVVRSSAGAVFALGIAILSARKVISWVRAEKMFVVAADTTGDNSDQLPQGPLNRKRIVLALGSEASGLSQDIRERCDLRLRIPHAAAVESLNVAVAGSILMKKVYELSQ